MSTIEWRPIAGYTGLYEVSSDGQVRSMPRRGAPGGIRVLDTARKGYLTVRLFRGGEGRTCKVHQLVAGAFCGPRPDGYEVRHLDGNPANNHAGNLRWGTAKENALDRMKHGTHHLAGRTHCKNGHPLSGDNLVPRPGGHGRGCRACNREKKQRHRERLRSS